MFINMEYCMNIYCIWEAISQSLLSPKVDNPIHIVGNWFILNFEHFDCISMFLLCWSLTENILSFLNTFGQIGH